MKKELTEREERMAELLRETTVALGCSLIEKVGEEEAARVFSNLMEQRVERLRSKRMLGKGFKALADMVLTTAPFFKQDVTFDVENMIARTKGCGFWEAGKKLGYEKTPLCIRCKANSDTVLKYVLPGYRKKIEKALWWGDDECYMTYYKEQD
jgi:hypothetical protein